MRELDDLKYNSTRRHFLSKTSLGIGALGTRVAARPALLRARRRSGPQTRRATAASAALRAARQARHLPVSVRRPVAARPVRPQAAAQRDERPGAARVGADGPAAHGHDRGPEVVSRGRLAVQVRAARQVGHVGQRAAAAHGEDRRRAVLRQVDAHRGDQSRSGHHVLPDRTQQAGPAERSAPGSRMGWAARTATCRRSS